MSSLPNRPAGFTSAACQCGAGMFTKHGADAVCRDCRHGQAIFEVGKLLADLNDLAAGRAPFDVLSITERLQFLKAFTAPPAVDPFQLDRDGAQIRAKHLAPKRAMAGTPDQALIDLIATAKDAGGFVPAASAELARRMPLSDDERAAIEQADELQDREATVRAEYLDAEPFDFF